ncbi:MAG: hypothetical protein HOH14_07130 [Gammaproteobacteria bacterium]|jgi:DnaJ-class molecular chaperone|nr:hypothetical protein [Gammaproteobacteria bacterium]MBT6043250.1 hypothetical protein [Gammaproteobacteria bacterium]
MNNLDHNKNSFKQFLPPSESRESVAADSCALQEIIEILKQPFQTSCDSCNGLGFVKSGQSCPTCDGSGKVLDNCFM